MTGLFSALTGSRKKRRRRREGHIPVMLDTVLEGLACPPGAIIVDGTFGGGGHSLAFLEEIPSSKVYALDQDPAAEERAKALTDQFEGRFFFEAANFRRLAELSIPLADSILLDLGVSSFQLDEGGRGFSFRVDAPLDMRMNTREGPTAHEFLSSASEDELVRAIRDYGEERSWRRIVAALVDARRRGFVPATTVELVKLIESCVPAPRPGRKILHPATLTFQGLRIAINAEMEALEEVLPVAFNQLKAGGRLAVISFHSLEDRMVKRTFRRLAGRPEHGFDSRPSDEREVSGKLLQTKPFLPTEAEIQANPRSRSARLRIIEKL